jgi:hypothetical protein
LYNAETESELLRIAIDTSQAQASTPLAAAIGSGSDLDD